MGTRTVAIGLLLAGCGRFGFDPSAQPDAPADGGFGVHTLQCGSPARFQVGAAGIEAMSATALPNGFAVFTVSPTGDLAAWSYEFGDSALAPTMQNVALDTDITGTIAAAAIGNDLVLSAVVGRAAPTGTRMYPLGPGVARRGSMVPHTQIGGMTALAASGASGALAFVTVDNTTGQVDARKVTALGADAGTAKKVVDGAESAGAVTIATAGGGYVVTWVAATPSPNELHAVLLDDAFNVVAGPINVPSSGFDPIRPRVVWAPTSNRYLFVWFEKDVANDDEIWIQVRDDKLAPITQPRSISPKSNEPQVATDGTDFYLAWQDYAPAPDVLDIAHVTSTGTVMPKTTVSTSGGTPKQWSMLEREGQAILAWTEVGGNGPDLWIDAMCP